MLLLLSRLWLCMRLGCIVDECAPTILKKLFGEQQVLALADYIQAALMLNYNQRRVG